MTLPRAAKTSVLAGIGACWVASLAYGFWAVREFESTPGAAAQAPQSWPATSGIPRSERSAQLVMFVHPKCSCTRASLEELAQVLKQLPAPVAAWIVIEGDTADSSGNDALTAAMARLPHVGALYDSRGAEGRRFGALTSGHAVLYDATGTLRFSGGITGARGHVGDNWGLRSLVAAGAHSGRDATIHAVYGCPL